MSTKRFNDPPTDHPPSALLSSANSASDKRKLIGRTAEKQWLNQALLSVESEFIALYGRRRVGKTFLIREHLKPQADLFCEFTGQKSATKQQQLFNFKAEIETLFYHGKPIPSFKSWNTAFELLADLVERSVDALGPNAKVVIFIDELPWLATPRSGLVQALDYVWNRRLSQIPGLTLVACGSAASWMIDHLIQAKGGLHNRVTRKIKLLPFTLQESQQYLQSRGCKFKPAALVELYMAIGGVAHYLRQVDASLSVAQNISKLCFSEQGLLTDEFSRLFASLFGDSDHYEQIVHCLSEHQQGMTRQALLDKMDVESGGRFNRRLVELEQAGFIAGYQPYNTRVKHTLYRLLDPYVYFYYRWIARAPSSLFKQTNYWMKQQQSQKYKIWSGYSFETLCMLHADFIAEQLGIDGIDYSVSSWRHTAKASKGKKADLSTQGAQIDLLFDRSDNMISICEVKYYSESFVIDKQYAAALKRKITLFEEVTETRKQVQLVLITMNGMKKNSWSEDLVDRVVSFEDYF